MIYEKRAYYVAPGRMPALHKRFSEHTLGFFKKHGINIVGFWEAYIGTTGILHYLLVFDDMAAREMAWAGMLSDQDWIRVRAQSEADGAILDHAVVEIWKPTAYSPMQ